MIGDLSTVWLAAFVRESDADKVKVGQSVKFSVLAQPERVFEARVKYVDAAIDPASRRRMVRAEIPNPEGLFSPEMFATARIVVGEDAGTPAVPVGAVVHEGEDAQSSCSWRRSSAASPRSAF